MKTRTLQERLERHIYYGLDGCWYWTGYMCKLGYGRILVGRSCKLATRVSYEVLKGDIPKGMYVCHSCDNPQCVNPDHLFLGTQTDNMIDMYQKGRHKIMAGESNGMSKLKEADVLVIRSGQYSIRELADMYNISCSAVYRVLRNKTYKNVKSC